MPITEAHMKVRIRVLVFAAGVALATPWSSPGFAGGDDYDAANDTEGKGPAYFGFVRDTRGSPVSNARVVLQPKAGEPVVIKSNALGLYRSHVSKEVAPDDVALSCEKEGYKQARVVRRTAPGSTNMFIEINCTLQKL
jgi:hypothetical protein